MFVRKTLAGALAAALAGSAIALTAGPAAAAGHPDDTTFTPTSADLIGAGSDTSQHALKLFADAWNNSGQAPVRIATYAATGSETIDLPSGSIPRPNGSGGGKRLLYGAGNNPDIDFARSSSGPSAAENEAGLQMFPFALDTLAMAVSNSTPSNAPETLTPAQIVGIYQGEITNWSEVGGKAGAIAPKIPQAGSGTRSFFEGELRNLNDGVAVTLGTNVAEVQEHDDTDIKNDPNAIAPFSKGRAGLLGNSLRLEKGWEQGRALYNVVRGADLGDPIIQAAFGEDGALCSTDARRLIEQAGFEQLATPANGGVCGQATQAATTNFTLNETVATTTSLVASSPKARTAKLVATVAAETSPSGTVSFFEGETQIAANVPLVSGSATYTVTGATPGAHTYTAVFQPGEGTAFDASTSTEVTVTVKTKAQVDVTAPAKVAKGKKAKVTVRVPGATGKVTLKEGKKTLGSKKLKNGKATFTVKLAKGKHQIKAVYAGNESIAKATKAFRIVQK